MIPISLPCAFPPKSGTLKTRSPDTIFKICFSQHIKTCSIPIQASVCRILLASVWKHSPKKDETNVLKRHFWSLWNTPHTNFKIMAKTAELAGLHIFWRIQMRLGLVTTSIPTWILNPYFLDKFALQPSDITHQMYDMKHITGGGGEMENWKRFQINVPFNSANNHYPVEPAVNP